ncbi:MAG: hypothetical protein ACKO7A_05735, partial [Microcystis sp.]
KWPMYLSLAALPLNAGLNYLLIFGTFGFPRMELMGAGIATFLTRVFLLLAMILLLLYRKTYQLPQLNRPDLLVLQDQIQERQQLIKTGKRVRHTWVGFR